VTRLGVNEDAIDMAEDIILAGPNNAARSV
jgi:hypothetical protein